MREEEISFAVRVTAFSAVLVLTVGCGGGLGPEDLARIEISGGNGQIATAGTPVEVRPAVLAVDDEGRPIPGATITFTVASGGGSVTGSNATTGEDGIGTVGSWTLGQVVGENFLTATAPGAASDVNFSAFGLVGPPATIERIEGDAQMATAGRPVPVRPRVRVVDMEGNAVEDESVIFTVESGGGEVADSLASTDSLGTAAVLSWTLGVVPGTNTLTATAGDASTGFSAAGIPGPVALTIAAGDSQTTAVGTVTPIQPQVLVSDAQDLPVPGVDVAFTVLAEGASVSADTARTNVSGIASVAWTLGPTVGQHSLLAEHGDLAIIFFTANATPGAPSAVVVSSGDGQFGAIGRQVPAVPAVLVTDALGNPVPRVDVTFTVTEGGGAVTGSPAATNGDGIARAFSWTLGSAEGQNTLVASVPGATAATFTATGLAEVFDIEIIRLGGAQGFVEALERAVNRWRRVVIGDLPDVSFADNPVDSASCGGNHAGFDDVVDDVRVFISIEAIDGPGNALAAAGPCITRDVGGLTVVGGMRFDVDDIPNLVDRGLLDDVIVHELGHVLGIGTLWSDFDMLVNPSLPNNEGADTHFTGARAIIAFDAVGGADFGTSKVPVENRQGGAGTRDSHWRESVFNIEAMTGFIDQNRNPLSIVSVESLGDLGYVVNSNGADAYSLSSATPNLVAGGGGGGGVRLVDDVWDVPIYVVDRNGRVTAVIRR